MTDRLRTPRGPVRWPRGGRAADVLVVCTGNICRSPYVAATLQQACPDLRIASAGTAALVGSPPALPVLTALDRLGLPSQPPARKLRAGMIRRATLILTMTHEQRADVLRLVPSAAERTFTLKEFARTVARHPEDAVPGDHARLVARVARRLSGHSPENADDLADPWGGPAPGYATMMTEADAAVRVIADGLNGGVR